MARKLKSVQLARSLRQVSTCICATTRRLISEQQITQPEWLSSPPAPGVSPHTAQSPPHTPVSVRYRPIRAAGSDAKIRPWRTSPKILDYHARAILPDRQ